MPRTINQIRREAHLVSEDARWALLINLEILLFRTPWWKLERQYKIRKLIRIYRKGLKK